MAVSSDGGADMHVESESSPSDTHMTLVRDGELTPAGHRRDRYEVARSTRTARDVGLGMDQGGGTQAAMAATSSDDQPGRSRSRHSTRVAPPTSRALPLLPAQRGPQEWHVSVQSAKGRHATCAACCMRFETEDLRIAKPSDHRGNKSIYLHPHCLPGGFHAQDTYGGPAGGDGRLQEFAASAASLPPSDVAEPVAMESLPMGLQAMSGDAWWTVLPWHAMFDFTGYPMIDVPAPCTMAYALMKDALVTHCLEGSPTATRSWKQLSMIDNIVLNARRPPGESQSQTVTRRLQQVQDGDWQSLWTEATAPVALKTAGAVQSVEAQVALIRELVLAEEDGRALKALKPRVPPMRDPRRYGEVQALFPSAADGAPPRWECDAQHQWTPDEVKSLARTITTQLRRPKRRTCPGLLGGRPEHWSVLRVVEGGLERAGDLLANLALGHAPEEVIAAHARSEVVTPEKLAGGLRPLLMGSACRRQGMRGVSKLLRTEIQGACGSDQLGTGAPDGCTRVFHAARSKCRRSHAHGIAARDVESAHQNLNRPWAAEQLKRHTPALLQPFTVWYARTVEHCWKSSSGGLHSVLSQCGLDQGDPIASAVFAVSTIEPADNLRQDLRAHDPDASVFQVADDVQVATLTSLFEYVEQRSDHHWAPTGLRFKPSKDQCWSLSPHPIPSARWQSKRVARLRCLGPDLDTAEHVDPTAPVAPDYETAATATDLEKAATKVTDLAGLLQTANSHGLHLQICAHLFRLGATSLVQHLISAKSYTTEQTARFDAQLRNAWQLLLGIQITDNAWKRGCLPFRLGGCSFGAIQFRAPAAHLSAWSRTSEFACAHVGVATSRDLLAAVPGLQQELEECAAVLRPWTKPAQTIPWEFGEPPTVPKKQAALLHHTNGVVHAHVLSQLPSLTAKARFRSSGGPGAGSFLQSPNDADALMSDHQFRIATTRRLGGCLRPTTVPDGQTPLCAHVGAHGPCSVQLDVDAIHATTCPVGGHIIQRHDRLGRWLCKWLSQGRTSTPPRMEQVLPSERGRLDVVFVDEGLQYWCDVAVTSAASTCPRSLRTNANTDGAAARAEEAVKRYRYRNRAVPIVVEADGRPGPSCLAFIRKFAQNCGEEHSTSPARAWSALSSVLQAGNAEVELAAWGRNALAEGRVQFFLP